MKSASERTLPSDFSMKALLKNTGGVADELAKTYAEPALVPETPWLAEGKPPAAPDITRGPKETLNVKAAAGTRFVVVRVNAGNAWVTSVHGIAKDGTAAIACAEKGRVVVTALDRTGRASEPVEVK